jgi:hypothetical protein
MGSHPRFLMALSKSPLVRLLYIIDEAEAINDTTVACHLRCSESLGFCGAPSSTDC